MSDERFDVAGLRAVVTGGAGGIGAAIAAGYARAGMAVVVADVVGGGTPAGVREVRCDVSSPDDVRRLRDEALERLGGIDVVVACAGTFVLNHVLETDLDAWNLMTATNLTGTLLCLQAFGPAMVAQGSGSFITVGSQLGRVALDGHAAYSATKAGVEMLTRAAANDLAATGVRVNCLVPGPVATERTRDILAQPETAQRMQARTLLGRHLEPADLVGPALFLASHASAALTGSTLVADGGYLAT